MSPAQGKFVMPWAYGAVDTKDIVRGTCEAGGSIKPGAPAPGSGHKYARRARETGDSVC